MKPNGAVRSRTSGTLELFRRTARRATFEGETSLVILGHDSLGAVQLQARPRNALRTPIEPGAIRVRPTLIGPTEWIMNRTGLLTPRM